MLLALTLTKIEILGLIIAAIILCIIIVAFAVALTTANNPRR